MNELHNYFLYVPILDDLLNTSEVELALNNIHRGTGIAGLPPIVSKILPKAMLCWLQLIQKVFMASYPEEWNKQILHAVAKKDYTTTLIFEKLQLMISLRVVGTNQIISKLASGKGKVVGLH